VPVYNQNNEVRGVLLRVCDGYELCDVIADLSLAQTGYAFVINHAGVMVAHPDRSMVAVQDPTMEKALATPEEAELGEMLGRMIQGETGVNEYTYGGVRKHAGYSPIQGTGWYLALTAPHDEVFAVTNRLQVIMAGATILLLLISIVAALLIANRIHKPLLHLQKTAKKFSEGDLDVDISVKRRDEIGVLAQALGAVADNMNKIISGIRSEAGQVAAQSKQIADSGQQFAQGTSEQASALEQITASVEEIAAQTRTNAGNAGEANALAASTRSLAERGNGKMDNLLHAMKDINQSSSDIARITKVIDDIAFQTNILALNAAVEAAHAGQYGRGFAVVAQEVRDLAAKSAEAASETAGLVQNSTKKVTGGVQVAEEAAAALTEIVKEISRVAALVNDISAASGEQSTGIEQINQGLLQVSQVVQANSTASQQNAAVSRHLTEQADMLNREVTGFHLRETGMTSSPAAVQKGESKASDWAAGRKKRKERASAKKKKSGKRFEIFSKKKKRSAAAPLEEDKPPVKPPMPAEISLDAEVEPSVPPERPKKVSLSDREFGKY
jgi:methyl-accepting chemotaxis protein